LPSPQSISSARLDEQFAERGDGILPYQLDTRDRAGWLQAKHAAEARFGPVDIVVNNAGIRPYGRR
jgi:NAD(P)-dependent dehydrogenase (short-subunit alcohol dehydrogenase family)